MSNPKSRGKKADKKAMHNPDGKHTRQNNPGGTNAKDDSCAVIALVGMGTVAAFGSAIGSWL